jgi:oxygen-independent coproporphyrinogen-3 oxidase
MPVPGHIGLYIHIPFCETKCPYCDFNTYAGIERLIPGYIDALCREIDTWGEVLGRPEVGTVFFGGGTPSYVGHNDLARIVTAYQSGFRVMEGAEITLEANPGDITPEKAAAWLEAGLNRVSIGVQSFDDGLLELLGRRHTAAQAEDAFNTLRAAGFANQSLDLMFGLPHQSLRHWEDSLARAMALQPQHISLYGLQLEHGTPLEAAVRTGKTPTPDEDLAADMYVMAEERLAAKGFRHYEISNWAIPGYESRHNLVYWENGPYLGVGPGAHSSLFGHRFANMKSPRGYMRSLGVQPVEVRNGAGEKFLRLMEAKQPQKPDLPPSTPTQIRRMAEHGPVDFVEETTPQLALAEAMMMGMRLDTGVSDAQFKGRFGRSLRDVFPREIDDLAAQGLVESDATGIRLTGRGRLLGNVVFEKFVAAAEAQLSLRGP